MAPPDIVYSTHCTHEEACRSKPSAGRVNQLRKPTAAFWRLSWRVGQEGLVRPTSITYANAHVKTRMKPLRLLPVIAHALAWAAFFGVVFWPFGFSTTRTMLPDGSLRMVIGDSPGPFMRYLGPGELLLLLIPVALTGLVVWLVWSQSAPSVVAKLAVWGLAALVFGYCSVPFWFIEELEIEFIGVFFWPAAAVSALSAIMFSLNRPT